MFSTFFFYFDADYDGVLGSPSFFNGVLYLCLTNAYWFTSSFKILNSYSSSFGSFHFLATSCMQLLPMNIGPFCSPPIDILLSVINTSCSFNLLVQLAIEIACHKLLSKSKSNIRITMAYISYSYMLVFDAQYPTLTLYFTSIIFICL